MNVLQIFTHLPHLRPLSFNSLVAFTFCRHLSHLSTSLYLSLLPIVNIESRSCGLICYLNRTRDDASCSRFTTTAIMLNFQQFPPPFRNRTLILLSVTFFMTKFFILSAFRKFESIRCSKQDSAREYLMCGFSLPTIQA